MKTKIIVLFTLVLTLVAARSSAQNVAINEDGSAPNANAILDVKSLTKGVLIPRVSTVARLAIPNTRGLLVYDTSSNSFWYNTGAAWQSLSQGNTSWLLTGNAGTDSSKFIGTTDNRALIVKVNNQASGRIDPTQGNAAWGYNAGFLMTDSIASDSAGSGKGMNNTALGAYSLSANFHGERNTATGFQSMKGNTTGSENTATGFNSLLNNSFGARNTAIGSNAMSTNTTGTDNTGIGYATLFSNSFGLANTAVGSKALAITTFGSFNTALGQLASELNTTGSNNVAVGASALTNSNAAANTAVGYMALNAHTTGDGNTAVGINALIDDRTGTNNTAIGNRATVSTGNLVNATAIGSGAIANASNKIRLGNSAVTVIEGQVPFTTPSDGRFKYQVKEDVKGLDFILHLRPVTYQFDVKRFDAQQKQGLDNKDAVATSTIMQAAYDEAAAIRRSGFIAQEVEKAANTSGYDFSGIIRPKTEQGHYSLSYESFVVPLVKGMQEQQNIILQQQQLIEQLSKKAAEQEKKQAVLEQQLTELNLFVHKLITNK